MNITVKQAQARMPVTIFTVEGDVDGSNFRDLINKAQLAIDEGAKALLLDLAQVRYMSSAGLLAIQTINAMLRGEPTPDPDAGWQALHKMEPVGGTFKSSNLRLLNLQPRVDRALDMVGFKQFIQVFTDRDAALASF
jgi:anti-anti-sigma regulatory factor